MDALEFAREKERMCDAYAGRCSSRGCPANDINLCGAIENIERLLPIVEKWSKEHQFVRNVDHVAEELEKLGYRVNKDKMAAYCPPKLSVHFGGWKLCCDIDCDKCRKWWLEEYKGEDINVLGKGERE